MYLTTVTSNQRFIVIVYWKPIFWLVRFTEQIRYSNRLHGYFFFLWLLKTDMECTYMHTGIFLLLKSINNIVYLSNMRTIMYNQLQLMSQSFYISFFFALCEHASLFLLMCNKLLYRRHFPRYLMVAWDKKISVFAYKKWAVFFFPFSKCAITLH